MIHAARDQTVALPTYPKKTHSSTKTLENMIYLDSGRKIIVNVTCQTQKPYLAHSLNEDIMQVILNKCARVSFVCSIK